MPGSSSWTNEGNFAAAWSDDSTTSELDGMLTGSEFQFAFVLRVRIHSILPLFLLQTWSGDNTFSPNGMYLLESVVFNCSSSAIDDLSQSCSSIDIVENKPINYLSRQ